MRCCRFLRHRTNTRNRESTRCEDRPESVSRFPSSSRKTENARNPSAGSEGQARSSRSKTRAKLPVSDTSTALPFSAVARDGFPMTPLGV